MFLLAVRNIFRNKRRSSITLASVIFAAFLVLAMRFLANGTHQEMISNAVSLNSGFLQIAAFGWLESKSIERALDVDQSLLASLKEAGVETISFRIEGGGLVSHKSESSFVLMMAADHDLEKKITNLHSYSIDGEFLHETKFKVKKNWQGVNVYPANIGHVLAKRLDVKRGDEITLVTNQFDGTVGAILAQVVGIYKTLNIELDSSKVLLPLSAGESLFGLGQVSGQPQIKRYTSLALGIPDKLDVPQVYEKLSRKYFRPVLALEETPENSDNYSPVAHSWEELIPGIVQMLEFDSIQNEATFLFLILIMSFGILNMVQMSIQQRTKELGVMIALGTKQGSLVMMVFWEVLLVLISGLILGASMGVGLGIYLHHNPIIFPPDVAEAYSDLGVAMIRIRTIVSFKELGIGLAMLVLPSLLFTLVASRRIYKINPTEILSVY